MHRCFRLERSVSDRLHWGFREALLSYPLDHLGFLWYLSTLERWLKGHHRQYLSLNLSFLHLLAQRRLRAGCLWYHNGLNLFMNLQSYALSPGNHILSLLLPLCLSDWSLVLFILCFHSHCHFLRRSIGFKASFREKKHIFFSVYSQIKVNRGLLGLSSVSGILSSWGFRAALTQLIFLWGRNCLLLQCKVVFGFLTKWRLDYIGICRGLLVVLLSSSESLRGLIRAVTEYHFLTRS
jgi:hypothetical protein